jgi:hypothetical protein
LTCSTAWQCAEGSSDNRHAAQICRFHVRRCSAFAAPISR